MDSCTLAQTHITMAYSYPDRPTHCLMPTWQ